MASVEADVVELDGTSESENEYSSSEASAEGGTMTAIGRCSEDVSAEVLGLLTPSILPRFAYWEGVLRKEENRQNDRDFLNDFVSNYYMYLGSSGAPSPRPSTLSPSPIPSFSPLLGTPPPFSPPPVPTPPPFSPLLGLSPPPPPPDSPPPLSSPPPPPPPLPPLSPFASPLLFTAVSPSPVLPLPDGQTNGQTNDLPNGNSALPPPINHPHAPQTNDQTNAFPVNHPYESTTVIDHHYRIEHNHHHHHFHNHYHHHYESCHHSFDPPPADPQPSLNPPGISPSRPNPHVGPPPSYNPPPFDFNKIYK